jgi:hypothetical protein
LLPFYFESVGWKKNGRSQRASTQLALDALFEGKPSRRPCETNRDDPFVYILQDPHGSITPSPLDNMRGLEYYLHDMMHNNAGSDGQDQQAKGGDEPD